MTSLLDYIYWDSHIHCNDKPDLSYLFHFYHLGIYDSKASFLLRRHFKKCLRRSSLLSHEKVIVSSLDPCLANDIWPSLTTQTTVYLLWRKFWLHRQEGPEDLKCICIALEWTFHIVIQTDLPCTVPTVWTTENKITF